MTQTDRRPYLQVVENTDEARSGEDVAAAAPPVAASRDGKDPPDPPANRGRKLDAKRINECLKHFSSLCNTLAAAIVGAAVIIPFVRDPHAKLDGYGVEWCAIGFLLHIFPYVLNFLVMQAEE